MLSIFVPLLGSLFCLIFPRRIRGAWSVIVVSLSFVFLLFLLPSIMLGKVIRLNLGTSATGFFSFSFLADGISLIFALVFSFMGIIKGKKRNYFKIDGSERTGQSTGFTSHAEEIISFYNTIFWPLQSLISTGIKARSILAFSANELEM